MVRREYSGFIIEIVAYILDWIGYSLVYFEFTTGTDRIWIKSTIDRIFYLSLERWEMIDVILVRLNMSAYTFIPTYFDVSKLMNIFH